MNDIKKSVLECIKLFDSGNMSSASIVASMLVEDNPKDILANLNAGNINRRFYMEYLKDIPNDNMSEKVMLDGITYYVTALILNASKQSHLQNKYDNAVESGLSKNICCELAAQRHEYEIRYVNYLKQYNSEMCTFESIEQLLRIKIKDRDINMSEFITALTGGITLERSFKLNMSNIEEALGYKIK